jgi:nicotinamidase-related amidase
MTAIPDRPNTALLVVDMQRGVVVDGSYNRDAVISNIADLVAKARDQDVPVVWVADHGEDRTPGSEPYQLVPELDRKDDEPLVDKGYGDSFEGTDLEHVLAGLGVGRLFVTGAQTDACIRSTIHGAFARGYDVTLVEDAHTTEDLTPYGAPITPDQAVAYTNMYWKYQSAPERRGGTVPTTEVNFHEIG